MARLLNPNEEGLKEAGMSLRNGKLVAFPTETVYGLGANAFNEDAVHSIFKTKGRPLTDPLIVHVPSVDEALELLQLSKENKSVFEFLAGRFWPGPLTLIAKASASLPNAVSAGTGFVGVRVPSSPLALRLLREARVPVCAPSANRFGHVSPTSAAHVMDDLGAFPISVLEDDQSTTNTSLKVGIESTVLKIDCDANQLILYRRGGVSQRALEAALSEPAFQHLTLCVVAAEAKARKQEQEGGGAGGAGGGEQVARGEQEQGQEQGQERKQEGGGKARSMSGGAEEKVSVAKEGEAQEAPGQLLTHYAPDVDTRLLSVLTPPPPTATGAAAAGAVVPSPPTGSVNLGLGGGGELSLSRCVVVDFGGRLARLRAHALAYRDLSSEGDMRVAAAGLFSALRWTEGVEGAQTVLLADCGDDASEHTEAVCDRMYRAASGRRVHVYASEVEALV